MRYTFAELDERANRSAHVLSALGLSKGDRIAVLLPNGHHFVEIFYAAARAGLIVVPLNWRLVADELAFLLRDSGATVVVFHSDHDAVVLDLLGRGKADDSGIDVSHWLRVGSNNPTWALDLEARVDRAPAGPLVVPTDASDPVFIMYTSGTTGLPKGVIHTHDSLQWAVLTSLASVDVRYRDRYLISLPLFHVGALSPMACCIYRGSTIILLNQFDPRFIWDVFRDENVTTTLAVPVERNARDLSARAPPTVGAALDHEWGGPSATLVDRGLCRSRVGGSPGIRSDRIRRPRVRDQSRCRDVSYCSTGKAFFHTDVRIVDEHGVDREPGVPGEVLVRGRHIMAGYWNRPAATAETIINGWLHTGDLAVQDSDGFVYIHDRIKDMIISGGENVYPAEIEDVLLSHPGISDVAVVAMPSARWGESPLAVVVRADPELDEAAVLAHSIGRLAGFKRPKRAVFVDAIPRTAAGKALKRVLREQFALDAPE